MFSISYGVGGTVFIKDDGDVCSWIDIYGDLIFPDFLDDSKKASVIAFLDKTNIKYNKCI
jgi:hypothetical protein